MRRRAAFLVALALVSLPIVASDNGTFHFGKVKFDPVDSFAYRAETTDPKKLMTIVVLTSFKIDRPAVLAAINTPGAFVMQSADKGSFVILRLVVPDKCGTSGFLGPTQQDIGLGDSFPAKTTANTTTRIAGECWTAKPEKIFDDAYDFHLKYDVPITEIPKPDKLPDGGGEAGAAYIALLKAIQTSNWDATHAHLPPDQAPAKRPDNSKLFFDGLKLNYPKSATVSGGLMKGDRANIDIRGIDHEGKKIKGIVALKKSAGGWQVLEQNFFFEQLP